MLIDLPGRTGRGFGDGRAHQVPLEPETITSLLRRYAGEGIAPVIRWFNSSSLDGIEFVKPALAIGDGDL